MATVITHAIAAGALSTIAPRALPRARLALTLAILSAAPDVDVIGLHYGIAYGDQLGHRGFTHSILFAVIAAFVAPFIAFPRIPRLSRTWWILVWLLFVATVSHGILDAFTDAGLGIGFFIPFDDTRYFAPWRPLATSPLSIDAFVNGPAGQILIIELIWVGLPLAGFLGLWHFTRWRRGR
ncbi:MAG: metal-dependent hydrolase [Proteobacteria bacterium]|nr:metal-dependent hydrolase [Pseudomonadota bacterium]